MVVSGVTEKIFAVFSKCDIKSSQYSIMICSFVVAVACRDDQFRCLDAEEHCIHASLVCDGIVDCGNWSDERNCSE